MYKVETVGDKYMVVSGVPEPLEDHARCICQLALEMKEAAEEREKMIEDDDIHVTITIGIHTGEVRRCAFVRSSVRPSFIDMRRLPCGILVKSA